MTTLSQASIDQNIAADPGASTWLSANAGSGKTRVLTDRVARLLLQGTNPQSILCLTYTKAAATEMQNRLFKRLGAWSMLDDDALKSGLVELGENVPDNLDRARTLFARAIETPGGLKVQTIHSFCAALLRQFPIEAGVSPQFTELDDITRKEMIRDVLDVLANAGTQSLSDVSEIFSGESLIDLAQSIASNSEHFVSTDIRQMIFDHLGAHQNDNKSAILDATVSDDDWTFLKSLQAILATSDKTTDQALGTWLTSLPTERSYASIARLEGKLLFGASAKNPFAPKSNTIPTTAFRNGTFAPHAPQLHRIMERLADLRPRRIAYEAAERTTRLHSFAADFLPAYAQAKQDRGTLDFDDLILKARDLLTQDGLAWVLYRLDGGIDHILVDEAQDTSPAQWDVIKALSAEITAGEGARTDRPRTIFVVGDKKQSIYSFQGADARRFDTTAEEFRKKLEHAGGLQSRELTYSFRSSPAILTAVDATFKDAPEGVGENINHKAFKADLPGRVDLWDLQPTPEEPDDIEWHDPVDRLSSESPTIQLAKRIAEKISEITKTVSVTGENGEIRPATAGDVLILVQGRGALFDSIISACKSAGLPIAGADRLKVTAELAVRDLLALLSFLALPEDDLSLATVLRSPLFGWTDQQLFTLANRRKGYLWQALREAQDDHPETFSALDQLRRDADFQRPYELLELILTRHNGRRSLMSRLGAEAEDGINELLNQALRYEQTDTPSLTGFLARVSSDDVEIKRQSDTSDGLIRVMTVHGAKGLEAPIVFLPDTMRDPRASIDDVILDDMNTPLWNLGKDLAPPRLQSAKEAAARAEVEERQRLLYVAMTRAKNWLIVGGVEKSGQGDARWHKTIHDGLVAAGATRIEDTDGQHILRLEYGDWNQQKPAKSPDLVTIPTEIPDFLTTNASAPLSLPKPLSPSDLGGAKALRDSDSVADTEAAKQRGTDIHLLLEHFPELSEDQHQAAAERLLPGRDREPLIKEAQRAIAAYPHVFDPAALAEVDVTAQIPALNVAINGTIDRLIVTDNCVKAIDFKTNQIVPTRAEDTPEGILRQMGAYLEALEQIYPNTPISLAVLWTSKPELMEIPHGIVRSALARATTS